MLRAPDPNQNKVPVNLDMNRAVFLDRDGVINALVYRSDEGTWDSPYALSEFRLLPRVASAIKLINQSGFLVIVASNQPGIAKAKCTLSFIEEIDKRLNRRLKRFGAHLDAINYCLHHPDGVIVPYAQICDCRKPKPGLLVKAAEEYNIALNRSYMIGDSLVDVQAGQSAGCRTILVGAKNEIGDLMPTDRHLAADNLYEAVMEICREEQSDGDFSRFS